MKDKNLRLFVTAGCGVILLMILRNRISSFKDRKREKTRADILAKAKMHGQGEFVL